MYFYSKIAFLLLLIIPLLLWLRLRLNKSGTLRFSSVNNAVKSGLSLRQRLNFLPILIRLLVIFLLIVALARPQKGTEQIKEISNGIAIEMIMDRSSSMGAEMDFLGQKMTRLDVVKKVFEDFVMGNDADLEGRSNDLIGMIEFARYPNTVCPLTLAHGAMPMFLDSIKLVQRRDEDGTAIGDAIALGAARLKKASETLAKQREFNKKPYEIKSKVIILLSDGENNCGDRDPIEGAELAKKWGVKIHTIAIGGGGGFQTVRTPLGSYNIPVSAGVDTASFKQISNITGGVFREAHDARGLYEIYKEIDKMERTEIESLRFVDYKENFVPLALIALILLFTEIILNSTIFRKVP